MLLNLLLNFELIIISQILIISNKKFNDSQIKKKRLLFS